MCTAASNSLNNGVDTSVNFSSLAGREAVNAISEISSASLGFGIKLPGLQRICHILQGLFDTL